MPGELLFERRGHRFVEEHERLRGGLGEVVEALLGEPRAREAVPDILDLPGDLPEREPELGRVVPQPLDLREQALEPAPIGLELADATFRLQQQGGRVLEVARLQFLGDAVDVRTDGQVDPVRLEDVPSAEDGAQPLLEELVQLTLEAGLGTAKGLEGLPFAPFGLPQGGLAHLAGGVRDGTPQVVHDLHLGSQVAADARRELGLRRRGAHVSWGPLGWARVRWGRRRLDRAQSLDRECRREAAHRAVEAGHRDRLFADWATGRHDDNLTHVRTGVAG